MAAVFLKLLNLSISASWLVLAVLVLRLVSKRSPKWVNVLLWGIVALRLVLPFSIESALSLIPSAETVSPAAVQFDPAPTITSGVSVIDNAVNPSLSEHFSAVPTASVNPLYVWTEIAGWVWLIGLGAMLLYALVSYLRLRRRVSVSLPVQDHIYLCDAISSPFILGVVKPHIYLPSDLDEVQRQNVLAHEQAHLARRDHWWKPLGFALLAVYWFNPVLWLAYTLLCRDIELACDERVIRTMDESAVKTYSTVLLACSMPRKAVITCPLAFGEVGVKERVRNALHYKKPAFWVVAASVAVCVVVAVCFLTDPEHETMKWAKNLRVDDVVRVELTIMPQATDKQYKDFNADEIAEAVALINKSSGRYVRSMEPLTGGSTELYVTTTDGVRHTVVNNGNVYLCIDGDAYRNFYVTWPYTEGDSPLPDSFQVGDTQAADANRFYVDDWSICIVGQWLRNAGTRIWWSDSSDAYLGVVKHTGLADELTGLQNAGRAVEELDGCYRCVTQEGFSNTVVYLYPAPSGESYYRVETHWSYDDADEPEVELQARQLRTMAESFRVENGSSMADALIGSYADDMGSSLTIRKNTDGSYAVDLGIYKFTSVDNTVGNYDPQTDTLYFSGAADIGGTLAADVTTDGTGRLIVTLTESPVSTSYLAAGAVFTFWPRVTGYPQYDVVLANICDLRLAGTHGTETDFSSDLLTANDYYQTPGWLLRDLDGDGIPELLLGANWDEGHAVIFNIYRYGGTRAVRVVNGWNRNRWYLCTDGSLANEGSSSAFESNYSYYRYTSGELQHLETLLYLDDGSGGSPWRYSVTTDQYVNSGDFHSVTEAEATAVMDKYTHETLAFTPFVV
ncbi:MULTISPECIES: M56 family metallopeptidase [Dysosmobacter]|uniref:M56 family metallopeptidase n=1 Tax=Dysosmobacter segnis TaxID=2763042 RepID=A0A923MLA5_9FIRM|nr:M56 family metallopeptidase [Dysosmobacter segnis]MBC5772006.1 M56 family metallopeptidase [Dysosmobacter segnis]